MNHEYKNGYENEYDNERFFRQYAKMPRSRDGLCAAGEWHQLKPLFPPLQEKTVLDLGCGYGWHCSYAVEQGAVQVLGIDLSSKMIEEAKRRNAQRQIEYRVCGIEEYTYPKNRWDLVVSNLALHYIENIDLIFQKVYETLKPQGTLPGRRNTRFLGCDVVKQHHTLTQILMGLLQHGFVLEVVEEVMPPEEMMDIPGMKDELRRPMMLLVRAAVRDCPGLDHV